MQSKNILQNRNVHVLGLPRTGTTSVAKALNILGFDVIHYCPITNPSTKDEFESSDYNAYVSSNLLLSYDLSNGLWILLHRDDWHESMWKMGEDICEWQEHVKEYDKLQCIESENLLHYDVSQGWSTLCNFLKMSIPKVQFPNLNSSY
jgi:hypothetical protein